MKSDVLVLRVSRYKFTDEKTGELVEGAKVTYCNDLDGVTKDNSLGLDIVTSTIPYSDFSAFVSVPAYYSVDFDFRSNGKGQPVVGISGIEFSSLI